MASSRGADNGGAGRRSRQSNRSPDITTPATLGLISDTHDLLRPEVFDAFAGVDIIVHAGDVGRPEILDELGAIAPVVAVWGNTDGWDIRSKLPETSSQLVAGKTVAVLHGHQFGQPRAIDVAARFPNADLVVFGHSHQPTIEQVGTTLVVNPGSAGPVRFTLPTTAAIATIADDRITTRLIHLLRG